MIILYRDILWCLLQVGRIDPGFPILGPTKVLVYDDFRVQSQV